MEKARRAVRYEASVFLLFLLCLTVLGGRLVLALAPVGSVTELVGIAKLSRGRQILDVVIKMAVMVHDRLQTMPKSHLTVTLNGGSQLMLAESSTMVIDEDASGSGRNDSKISLLLGHLRASVHLTSNASSNFEVHTPNAVVGVRGTEFETAYIEGKPCPGFPTCLRYTEVGVYKGVVEVSNPTNPSAPPVRVTQGYETTVPCDLAPTPAAPLGMSELGAPGYR
jgi:ferric-dicitrate binding protein FerR (iron transport regulator)